jgi:hypothetical protein
MPRTRAAAPTWVEDVRDDVGHDIMIDQPAELAALLESAWG